MELRGCNHGATHILMIDLFDNFSNFYCNVTLFYNTKGQTCNSRRNAKSYLKCHGI